MALVDRRDTEGGVDELRISPDGSEIAVTSTNRTVERMRVEGLAPLPPIGNHPFSLNRLAYSPDGSMIATGSDDDDDIIRIWGVADRALRYELRGQSNQKGQMAFSPDGSALVAGSNDWTVAVWYLDPAEAVRRVCAVAVPDGAALGKEPLAAC